MTMKGLAPILAFMMALGLASHVGTATAAEGGASNYPYGALTTYAALLPPSGETGFYGYVVQYSADRIVDVRGKTIPGASVELFASAPRIVHTWKQTWSGFSLSSGGVIQVSHLSVEVPGAKDSSGGPTLVAIEPLYLTRAFGSLHVLTGAVAYLPLGSYDADDLANSTAGFVSYAYQLSTTWIPTPRWDLSLAAVTEFKERNKQTRYRSGKQSGITFALNHRPFVDPRWEVGVTGFYTKQITDDDIGGEPVPGGGRTRKYSIGPKLSFWLTSTKPLIVQWHPERGVCNGPRGDLFWLEFGFPLHW